MKFLADECCDTELVASLRGSGHDIIHISEETTGIPDEKILNDAFTVSARLSSLYHIRERSHPSIAIVCSEIQPND